MKVSSFHLMPYRFLPDDFERRYRSVWVDVPRSLYDASLARGLYHEYLDELERAEQAGFDGLCVNEHHANAYGLMPSPNLMAATLTRRTSRAAIVVLGNSLAAYQPPLRVAEEFAMLDVLSGGRLVAGFPVGTSMDMNFAYGLNPATLRERYHEAHDLVVQAWTRPEVFAFNGKYTKLRYVNTWPQPVQKPYPPIWIPGSGSLETWALVTDVSDGSTTTLWSTPADSDDWSRVADVAALTAPADLAVSASEVLVAGQGGKAWLSTGDGAVFSEVANPCAGALAVRLSASGESVWASCVSGTSATVVQSSDGGRSFSPVPLGWLGEAPSNDALVEVERALALRPDVPGIHHTRARALIAVGRLDDAIAVLEAMRAGGELPLRLEAERCRELAAAWERKGQRDYADDYRDRARLHAI